MSLAFGGSRFGDEFVVARDDFSALQIRPGEDGVFHFFYDAEKRRLIKHFVIHERPRVDTLCDITLIKKDGKYDPRVKIWKKDKSNASKSALEEKISGDVHVKTVKASVNAGDDSESSYNFWKLIQFLQSFADVDVPSNDFRVVSGGVAQLAKSLGGEDKSTIVEAVRISLGGSITEEDLQIMSNRKEQLNVFERMLNDVSFFEEERSRLGKDGGKSGKEAVWQKFFEANQWIFGYGLNLVSFEPLDESKLERITTGASIFTGAGKRVDAIMRTRGVVSSLAFCEIKTHEAPLLERRLYRDPDVYQVSKEVSGGLSQIQKTVGKALDQLSRQIHDLHEDDGTPTGIQFSTVKPRQVLVVGNLAEFRVDGALNPEKMSTFEFYRNSIRDVEIITFDELYERARFIVRDR
ncbi:Shedu immune nuclease family protein [Nocardiopsis nanhaiensis]